jgi:hypothetical protein
LGESLFIPVAPGFVSQIGCTSEDDPIIDSAIHREEDLFHSSLDQDESNLLPAASGFDSMIGGASEYGSIIDSSIHRETTWGFESHPKRVRMKI